MYFELFGLKGGIAIILFPASGAPSLITASVVSADGGHTLW